MKILHLKTISALTIIILFSLFNGVDSGYAVNTDGKKVYYTLLKGTINKGLVSDFEGVLKEAEKAEAEALVLEIDTWIANLTGHEQVVEIKGVNGPGYVSLLDEPHFIEAVTDMAVLMENAHLESEISGIHLGPYAVAVVRWKHGAEG